MFEYPIATLSPLCNSCAKIACCSPQLIFTFLHADISIENVSAQFVLYIRLSSVNFALYLTPRSPDIFSMNGTNPASLSARESII